MKRSRAEELRRLREVLYRPDPPPGAAERYRVLARLPAPPRPVQRPATTAPHQADPTPAGQAEPTSAPPRRRGRHRRRLVAGVVTGALLVSAGVAVAVARPGVLRSGPATEPLIAGGPYAVRDQEALGNLLDADATDVDTVLEAVRGSTLPQLAQWDTVEAGAWIQRGRGPRADRAGGGRPSDAPQRFSLIMRCTAPDGYRWTLSGTTPKRPEVHAVAVARAERCGAVPTVTTFTLPAGTSIRGVALTVPDGSRWATAVVYRLR